ncbi:hypothetical protein L3X38_011546 [Prunus dulcis]|uniref:Uncharacterized protein n=1 Tax=Prunus dulcis TaxID=3755 RepID=A0AAD4WHK8_PRUDU|nr:hypothetical protein L3X38_011546 [Prunus dulcis]
MQSVDNALLLTKKVRLILYLSAHNLQFYRDDIDFDRRQLSSSHESSFERSERAVGESACTTLVAVIVDWLKSNRNEMPIKCEFDSLVIDGSSEWRTLCDNEAYIERFLEISTLILRPVDAQNGPTKIESNLVMREVKVRGLHKVSMWDFVQVAVVLTRVLEIRFVPEKSFIGFFHPEELENRDFDFLQGAISFDSIWDEIVFLHQNMLAIFNLWSTLALVLTQKDLENSDVEEEVACKGREACKDYIKSFLAAIPIRELLADLKKGLMASTPLHHRLQIEFHCTKLLQSMDEYSVKETAAAAPAMAMALAVA